MAPANKRIRGVEMVKNITIKTIGRYDDISPFILAENENLKLKINFEKRLRGDYYLLGNINEKTFSFCLNNTNEIVLTELSAGVLNLKLTIVHSGQVYREWRIEPLIIKQLDDGKQFACEQTLTNFNRRLSTCEKAILELTNLIKNKGGLL